MPNSQPFVVGLCTPEHDSKCLSLTERKCSGHDKEGVDLGWKEGFLSYRSDRHFSTGNKARGHTAAAVPQTTLGKDAHPRGEAKIKTRSCSPKAQKNDVFLNAHPFGKPCVHRATRLFSFRTRQYIPCQDERLSLCMSLLSSATSSELSFLSEEKSRKEKERGASGSGRQRGGGRG